MSEHSSIFENGGLVCSGNNSTVNYYSPLHQQVAFYSEENRSRKLLKEERAFEIHKRREQKREYHQQQLERKLDQLRTQRKSQIIAFEEQHQQLTVLMSELKRQQSQNMILQRQQSQLRRMAFDK